MPPRLERAAVCVRWGVCSLVLVAAALLLQAVAAEAQTLVSRPSPREQREQADREQIERTHRDEGEAILALADAAMSGKAVPSDFAVSWHNDFVKAQRGTFVPFTLSVDASAFAKPSALVYVRAIRRREAARPAGRARDERESGPYPVDAIFPVELTIVAGVRARISRGFAVEPGEYDVVVVMRERVNPGASHAQVRASVLRQPLAIPEFPAGELAASSLIVGERMTTLAEMVPADQLAERPYAIGRSEITPSVDRRFRRGGELIVVLLVYNPMVTGERQFDLKVEYHFFRRSGGGNAADVAAAGEARVGEQYFNRTDPQRFNPALMGAAFDPRGGEPVMAGQVVPLTGFEEGEYRLDVQVLDLLSGKSISRDVVFTVGS
jgi:hypothetical protein